MMSIASGILLVLSFPPFDFFFLPWIALVPFLYALANTEFKKGGRWGLAFYKAQILGVLLGLVFYYGTLYWLYNIFGVFGLLLISVCFVYTIFYAHILNYVLSKWRNPFTMLFFPAVLWVSIEYFKSEGWWMKFSWMNLGYSQHGFLPALQCASICGQYGISFLLVFVNSVIVFLIVNRANRRLITRTSILSILGLGAILAFGLISAGEDYDPNIKVGLVQDESSDFRQYARLTEDLPPDVDFILWPEYAVPEFIEEESELLDRIRELTVRKNSHLIIGAKERAEEYSSTAKARMMREQGKSEEEIDDLFRFYNTAYLFSPSGDILGKYHKANPIQFFADGVAGKDFAAFETEFGRAGVLICYDTDYSYVARRITRNGAEMLFIPTYDAMGWSALQHKQHSAMTSMRAVENGRFIARAATSGISQIIDPKGRVTCSIGIGESDAATGLVERIDTMTFYTQCGFVFPYLCIFVSLASLVFVFLKKSA